MWCDNVGIDASRVTDFRILNGNETIQNVMFYNLKSKNQFNQLLEQADACLKLKSYGYAGELDEE